MSIQYSNLADPKLIAAIDRVADSINRLTALMFPVVKNCGTCRFFDRKNLLDGVCFVDGKENVKRRRVTEMPCEKHEDFFESKLGANIIPSPCSWFNRKQREDVNA